MLVVTSGGSQTEVDLVACSPLSQRAALPPTPPAAAEAEVQGVHGFRISDVTVTVFTDGGVSTEARRRALMPWR